MPTEELRVGGGDGLDQLRPCHPVDAHGAATVLQAGGLSAPLRAVRAEVLLAVRMLAVHADRATLLGMEALGAGEGQVGLESAMATYPKPERRPKYKNIKNDFRKKKAKKF